jgi:diguanylate cyclase (GGDEF)-like protein
MSGPATYRRAVSAFLEADRVIGPATVRARRVLTVVLASLLALHALIAVAGASGHPVGQPVERVLYVGLLMAAAALCLWRAIAVPHDRWAWGALAAGLILWTSGEIVWSAMAAGGGEPPVPSVADGLWLAYYPAAYLGLGLLIRSRLRDFRPGMWLDGLIVGLAAASLGAAVLVAAVRESTGGSRAEVATNMAYPIGDVALLAMVAGALALMGWRPGRALVLVALSLLFVAFADGIYVYQAAAGTYVEGSLLDTMWLASALLLGAAPWMRQERPGPQRAGGTPVILPTVVSAMVAIGILTVDHVERSDSVAVALSAATLVAVAVRATLAFRENETLLTRLSREALTDPLTGLGNRRRLIGDLDDLLAAPGIDDGRLLMILDLDGFKGYNDAFGHPAGDALLQRLGARLAAVTAPWGRAYRLGGDEFCVLAALSSCEAGVAMDAASGALNEGGEGFEIRASMGAVFLPDEAADTSAALREVDRRLYANKRGRRASADSQIQSALSQAIQEREPDLSTHLDQVVLLAAAVARRMGLPDTDIADVARAAALHDVGKLAIPDAILQKPGPLSDDEAALMRTHTLVGERILAAAPSLHAASRIVRHSHERWDGGGYPDGIAGESIPLGSRIVAVCDAFDAMISDRCYRRALAVEDALDEIDRCSGTQFDPRAADALRGVIGDRDATASRSVS